MSEPLSNLILSLESAATPSVPYLSTAAFLGHPDNATLAETVFGTPDDPQALAGKVVAVVTTDGVEEVELLGVVSYFKARGASVRVVAPRKPKPPADWGMLFPTQRETHILTIQFIQPGRWVSIDEFVDAVAVDELDAVIVPGGTWNPDTLRADPDVLELVRDAAGKGKVVAAICHGPWVLGDAGLLKGRNATAWPSMKNDVTGAGATYVDEAAVTDGRLVTSRSPNDLGAFVGAIHKVLVA